jgi:hypothetical protein
MIKTLIIVVLFLALAGGAALTCPSEASFKAWYTQRAKSQGGNFVEKIFEQSKIDGYLKDCTYKSRIVWADVEKDGQVIATGAFDHWIARGAEAAKSTPAPTADKK